MKTAILTVVALIGSSALASAASLYTPPFFGGGLGTGGTVVCRGVNVSSAARSITVTLTDATGTALATNTAVAAPGTAVAAGPIASPIQNVLCRIDVAGGKKTVRGGAVFRPTDAPFSGQDVLSIPAY